MKREEPKEQCPNCGDHFNCGVKAGVKTCWCQELSFKKIIPPAGENAVCYCPKCLESKVPRGRR